MKYFDDEMHFVGGGFLEVGEDSERSIEVGSDPVVHEDNLAFRWSNFKGFGKLKFAVVDGLVEVAVFENYAGA